MARKKTLTPSFEELNALPRWARVVLLARAARRIQPLFLDSWPAAPKKYQEAIEASISAGEDSAAQGKAVPAANGAGVRCMAGYGEMPDELRFTKKAYGDEVPFACARVSLATKETEPWLAQEGLDVAARVALEYAEYREDPRLHEQFLAAMQRDFAGLVAAAKAGKWNAKTPVDGKQLGELWPEGLPQGWPASNKPVKPRKEKPVDLEALGLPSDLVAFLREGKQLKYRAAKTEVGAVKLLPMDHLRLGEFLVEQLPGDGAKSKKSGGGLYKVRGVDLVGESDGYGPEGLFVWLPDWKCFGSHDEDHAKMVVFPAATWTQIVASPAKFLDAQWNDFEGFGRYLDPTEFGKRVRGKA
jgi:hypothetical protein